MIFGHYECEVCQALANPDLELAIETRVLMWGGGNPQGYSFIGSFQKEGLHGKGKSVEMQGSTRLAC